MEYDPLFAKRISALAPDAQQRKQPEISSQLGHEPQAKLVAEEATRFIGVGSVAVAHLGFQFGDSPGRNGAKEGRGLALRGEALQVSDREQFKSSNARRSRRSVRVGQSTERQRSYR